MLAVPADGEPYPHGGTTRLCLSDALMAWHKLRHQLHGNHLSSEVEANHGTLPVALSNIFLYTLSALHCIFN
jgi:hypothetical protein